jgi:hypothetical protein
MYFDWWDLRAPGLGRPHRRVSILIDFDDESPRIVRTSEPPYPSRAPEEDRMGFGARLHRETLGNLLLQKSVEAGLPRSAWINFASHAAER